MLKTCPYHILTRSSAVAVIADRTAYDVRRIRYTGKLSNRFRLKVDERPLV